MLSVFFRRTCGPKRLFWLVVGLVILIGGGLRATPVTGQSAIPSDQFHLTVTLGGHFLVGLGYTNWVEQHHALEFTLFPFAHPKEGFPFGVRAGYAWVPSDEIWRAKLGANMTLLFRTGGGPGDRFTPTVGLTPGILYIPDSGKSFRGDFWMSYYIRERAFVPTGLEFLYNWTK
jgi:hypothetical protein